MASFAPYTCTCTNYTASSTKMLAVSIRAHFVSLQCIKVNLFTYGEDISAISEANFRRKPFGLKSLFCLVKISLFSILYQGFCHLTPFLIAAADVPL